MNLKRFTSVFLSLFASLMLSIFVASESFAATYQPEQTINYDWVGDVSFIATYAEVLTTVVSLDNAGATTKGTEEIYIVANDAVYLDADKTKKITTNTNPITVPERKYTVTYNTNGGNTISSATVEYAFDGYFRPGAIEGDYPDITSDGYIDSEGTLDVMLSDPEWFEELNAWWTPASVTLPTPTRAGYKFAGWYIDSDLTRQVGDAGSLYTPTADVTLYAKWTSNKYTITLDNADATTNGTAKAYFVKMDTMYLDADMTKPMTTTANPITVPKREYTVTYNVDGGTLSSTSAKVAYSFAGYYNYSAATAGESAYRIIMPTGYVADGQAGYIAATNSQDITLYAKWTSGSVTLPTPSRTGYTFGGWYKESALTNKVGDAGASYTPTANVTLYAKWTANTFKIAYANGGGTGSAPTSPTSCTYAGTCKAPANTYTRAGYEFNGWACTASSGSCAAATYAAGADISRATTVAGATITLTATWKTGAENTITLDAAGGVIMSGSSVVSGSTCTVESADIVLPTPTKTGYTFVGWYNAAGTKVTTIAKGTCTEDISLTARWTANTITIVYDTGVGVTVPDTVCTYDQDCFLAGIDSFSKSGHVFKGWAQSYYDDWLQPGQNVKNIVSEGNVNLGAIWQACDACSGTGVSCQMSVVNNTCTYTTTCLEGYGNMTNSGKYNASCSLSQFTITYSGSDLAAGGCDIGSAMTLPTDVTKTGYTFAGWYTAQTGGTRIVELAVGECNADMTVYARWTPNNYAITLDNASATTNGTASIYTTYNTNVYLDSSRSKAMTTSANAITKPSRVYTVTYNANSGSVSPTSATSTYTFKGYYSAASNGTQYINASGNITSDGLTAGKGYTAAKTWNAQWTGAAVTLPTPSRTGYTFGGWYKESALTNKVGDAGASYTPTANVTLYAKWTANTYTVTLDSNGGTGGSASVLATYDALLPAAEMPTYAEHDFNGYWSAKTGGKQYYDVSGNPVAKWDIAQATTLYAQWTEKGKCAPGTYYNATSGKVETCPAGSYCAGGTWSATENLCAIEPCPTAYPKSVAGASEEGQCYVESTSKCWCVENEDMCKERGGEACSYGSHRFNGVYYSANPNECVAAPGSSSSTYCEIIDVYCAASYYYDPKGDIENGRCKLCSSLGDGSYTKSNSMTLYPSTSAVGSMACYKIVDLPCTEPVCPTTDTGTCSYDATDSEYGGGYLFYGLTEALPGTAKAYVCPDATFTCNAGYDKNTAADIDPTDGAASDASELCTPHVYTMTLDSNGGSTANSVIYEKYKTGWFSNAGATTKITNVAIPVRQYYTFTGYYTKKTAMEGSYTKVVDASGNILVEPDMLENTTLYAWWTVNTYTVVYNANGGTGSMASVQHTCTEAKNLTKNAFTHSANASEFLGWATNSSATQPEYTDGQSVVNLSDKNGATVTLYAVWKACTACSAGTGATCSLTAPLGVCTYATACKAHYENISNNGKYNPSCSATKYGITYETNGGVISSSYNKVDECSIESAVITLPTAAQITREDYRFDGWYDNSAFSGSAVTTIAKGTCLAAKTLYAKWVINVATCQVGKYYNGNEFITCPKGYYCPGSGKVTLGVPGCSTACPNGYDDGGTGYGSESQCEITVPQGSYLVTAKGTEMAKCANGTYTAAAVNVAYGKTNSCSGCEANSYCEGGTKYSCSDKTGGVFANSADNSDSITDCYTMTKAGKYITGNAEKTCAAPYYCPGNVKVTYGNVGGQMACGDLSDDVTWESGITVAGATGPEACYVSIVAGKYWTGNEIATCQSGTYKVAHKVNYGQTSTCEVCASGYKSESGASQCYLVTTAGKYVATAGAGQVTCKVGDYCPGGDTVIQTATGGNKACSTFGAGYTSDAGATAETQCYQRCALSANATAMSGRDYYNTDTADTCVATECEVGYILANGVCGNCPEGSVCEPGYDGGKPHTCSERTDGKYPLSGVNTVSIDGCYMRTTAGSYVATAGAGQVICKVGDYCPGGVKVTYTSVGGNTACSTLGVGYTSDAGVTSAMQCYQRCSLSANATAMSGRDYYGTDATDTCEAVKCEAGYTLKEGKCELCPANHVCAPEKDDGKPYTCSELTGGTHKISSAGSGNVSDCYVTCESYDIEYGTAVPVSKTEFWPTQCQYEGVSDTGNPCDIVDGVCVEKTCNYNYEMINGSCKPCARENAVSYKKDAGNCIVESCVSGFHPNGQACEANTVECSAPNAKAAAQVWDSTKNAFGECAIVECNDGYHLGANACQLDEQVCDLEHGVGLREWNHKTNTWGDCVATKCDPGYTNDRSLTNELWKQCGRCNNMYSAGGDLAASSYIDGCEIASCMYEGELYTLENNECLLICDEYSDETGSRRWNASRKKCEHTCTPGYMPW